MVRGDAVSESINNTDKIALENHWEEARKNPPKDINAVAKWLMPMLLWDHKKREGNG